MKKQVWMAAVLAGAMVLTGCGGKKEDKKADEAAVQTEASGKTASADEADEDVSEKAEEAISEEASEIVDEAIVDEITERPDYTALDHVTVGEYTGLTVTVDDIEITDDQIDARIEQEISDGGFMEEIKEGKVQEGDIANIDYVGKKDGVAFDGGTAEGYDLTIGSHTFIDGFEDGLIDVKIGDTVDLDLTFPEEYHSEDLAGADVVFTVTVNSVKRMPQVTDELVSSMTDGVSSTVDAYRETIKDTLTKEAEEAQLDTVRSELMTQLYNTCKVNSYPEDLVEYSKKEMRDYYEAYAQSMGVDFSEFLTQYFGMDEETFEQEVTTTIETSLEQEMILMAIAEKEGLRELSDEEFEAGCKSYAERMGYGSADEFKAAYDEARIRASIALDAAMDYVVDKAVIVKESEVEAISEKISE